MPDILITTQRGTSNNPSMQFTGSALANIKMEVLPSGSIAFIGTSGSLFSITDNLIGSLMSVGDVSGLPILEVFSDDRIVMGKYNKNTLYVSGTNVGVGKVPLNAVLDVSGSVAVTGSLATTGAATFSGAVSASSFSQTAFSANSDALVFVARNTSAGNDSSVRMRLGNDTSAAAFDVTMHGSNNVTWPATAVIGTQVSSPLVFVTNTAERLRIASSGAATFAGDVTTNGTFLKTYSAASNANAISITQANAGGNSANASALIFVGNSGSNPYIACDSKFVVSSAGAVTATGVITTSATEAIRINNDSGYIAFYNTAASTRTAYIQANAGSNFTFAAENGAAMAFSTNASTRMYINTSGNVGIGTTSPQGNLDIFNGGNAAGTPLLSIRSGFATTGNYGMIRFGDQSQTTSYQKGAIIYESVAGSARGRFHIALENTDGAGSVALSDAKLTVLSSGNVGIGTTSPSAKLDLYNATDLGSGANGIRVQRPGSYGQYGYLEYLYGSDQTVLGSIYTGNGANVYGQIYFRQHSSTTARDVMVINSSGNVGIGTTSPQGALTVKNTNDDAFILLGNNTQMTGSFGSIKASYNGNITTYKVAAAIDFIRNESSDGRGGDIYLKTNAVGEAGATTKMVVNGAGNVGIGTTSPTGRLQIHNASGNTIALYKDTGAAALALGSTTGPTEYALIESINAGGVRFFTGNGTLTEKVRIDVNGNIGIGKSTPNAVLDVNGNTIISGSSNDVLTIYRSTTAAARIACINTFGTGWAGVSGAGMVLGGQAGMATTIYGGGTASLAIDSGGNTAIGKTSPINAKLDVNGNTIITGSLATTGAVTFAGAVATGNLTVTGDITATGNITAYYSDDRLKNNLGNIPDSLNKVLSLNGFYFEPNQTAIDLGYTKQKEVGVSAQQVQAILPEIIAAAPIDPMYMTVRYEKLIPLLIEAIKEQNSMIVDLQQRINVLEK